MADRLAPDDIARASFGTVRRGYEPQAVRGFLHEVSALVDRLTRSERELREQLQRAEAKVGPAGEPDESMLLEVLGAETTRVLTSARDAASEIRSKAEEAAERIISEATSEAAERRATALTEVEELVARMTAEAERLREAAHNELELRRAEAHAASERIQEEGHQAAQALREQGELTLANAREEAAAIIEAAQQQGKEMVAEAQAVRERVLRDLAVRRKRARQQVEKLNAGRERLLRAYDTVRGTLDEATAELHGSITEARAAANAAAQRVDEEPEPTIEQLDAEVAAAGLADLPIADTSDLAELLVAGSDHDDDDADHDDDDDYDDDDAGSGPLSGEVPTVGWPEDEVPTVESDDVGPRTLTKLDERRGRKGRRKKGFEGLPPSELTVLEPPRPEEGVRVLAEPAVDPDDEDDAAAVDPATAAAPEADAEADAGPDASETGPAAGATAATEPDVDGAGDDAPHEATASTESTADDVFARLREQTEASHDIGVDVEEEPGEGTEAAADGEDASEGELDADDVEEQREEFVARADAVTPIEKDLLKRLKRALADEQNEVLDLLRRAKPKGVDDVLPAVDEHLARWVDASSPALVDAASAGAASVMGKAGSVTALAGDLARALVDPLRERIDRSFVAADGDLDDVADRIRALYREWKGQHLTEATQHFTAAAYARGVFDGIPAGAAVHWVIDAASGACPDCEDNVLAGAVAKGEEFPTGSATAPAHPGCHCLVLPHTG